MDKILIINFILLWVVVLFNLLLTLALVRRFNSSLQMRAGLKVGQMAPNFTAEMLNGERVTLETYAKRSVAFLFISPHCNLCRDGIPGYEALRSVAEQSGVELVLVSDADPVETRSLVNELSIRLPILVATQTSNPFIKDYKISSTPSYCLVNPQGKIQSTGYPIMEWAEWKALTKSWETKKVRAPAQP